jgi:hypothetical protein
MTSPLTLNAAEGPPVGRRTRLVLAILATLVLLAYLGIVEVGALTMVTVISSSTNHEGGR